MKLFGHKVAPFFLALAQVESDKGATATNVYRLSQPYVNTVNRIMHLPGNRFFPDFRLSDIRNREKSEDMILVYLQHFGIRYQAHTGNVPDLEVLSRIFSGGPVGWKRDDTLGYWFAVRDCLLANDINVAERFYSNHSAELWRRLCRDRFVAAKTEQAQ